ncbi:MAG TPA: hypothetical protein DEP87_01335 [Candidatus Pacebacteria bacterium]|nr:hypothetical protein [Candidatus Paceibacterota bacterium]
MKNLTFESAIFDSEASAPSAAMRERVWSNLETRIQKRHWLTTLNVWLAGVSLVSLVSLGSFYFTPRIQTEIATADLSHQLTDLDQSFTSDPLWQEVEAL